MPEEKGGGAVEFLDRLLEFFEDGRRWTSGVWSASGGRRCLFGAIRTDGDPPVNGSISLQLGRIGRSPAPAVRAGWRAKSPAATRS